MPVFAVPKFLAWQEHVTSTERCWIVRNALFFKDSDIKLPILIVENFVVGRFIFFGCI